MEEFKIKKDCALFYLIVLTLGLGANYVEDNTYISFCLYICHTIVFFYF